MAHGVHHVASQSLKNHKVHIVIFQALFYHVKLMRVFLGGRMTHYKELIKKELFQNVNVSLGDQGIVAHADWPQIQEKKRERR